MIIEVLVKEKPERLMELHMSVEIPFGEHLSSGVFPKPLHYVEVRRIWRDESYHKNKSHEIFMVSSEALIVRQNGNMDIPGCDTSKVMGFGNPVRLLCSGNRSVTNVYYATGEKLKTVHAFNVAAQAAVSLVPDVECASVLADGTDVVGGADPSTTEYHGSLVCRNGSLDMVLFPGGYATVSGSSVIFHYYTQDYLGNNRAVINGSTGAIEQTVAYYPYGAVIADLGTNPTTVQPYKFGGKELITANGLNEYDFGARQYYSAVPFFTKPDPLCEDTQWLSPYLYCGNNPVNAIDPDGRSTWVTDQGDGRYQVIGGDINDKDRRVYVYNNDKNGNPTVRGKAIGITATMTSFYDSDRKGDDKWMTKSVIDTRDYSGDRFLSNLMHNNPPLFNDYMVNARNGGCYDFKATNGTSGIIEGIDYYRGMPIGETGDGMKIYASARDIGNIGAGYMAAVNGLSCKISRMGFDGYQSLVSGKPTIEGLSTRNAEYYGFRLGYNNTTSFNQAGNLGRSISKGLGVAWTWLKSRFIGL